MDNGNLALLDYTVPARRFRNNIPCMKGGVAIIFNTNVEWRLPIFYWL